jgi:hypothetical protein
MQLRQLSMKDERHWSAIIGRGAPLAPPNRRH